MVDESVPSVRTTAGAAGWSGVSTIVLRLGGLAVGIVIARVLTTEQFGVYAVALTVQSILMTVADLGLSAELIRSSDPERRAPTVATLGLTIGGLLTLGTVLAANPVANLLDSPAAAPAIAVLAFTLVLGGAGVVPYAYLQRRFQQRELFLIAVVDFVISTGVTLGLIAAGWGVLSLAVGRLTAQTSTTVLQFVFARTVPRFRIDRTVLGAVLTFGLPIAGANLLSWALLNVDNVVIARLAGATALGYYVLAFNMSSWPMTALSQMVRSVSLPFFARVDDRAADAVPRLVAIAWAGALPAGALLVVLSSPVIEVVYGARWLPAAPVLAALGMFGSLRVVFDIFAGFLYARGRSRPVLWVQLVWFIAIVIGMIIATRAYGIVGAGWVHVIVAVAVILPAYVVALRSAGVGLGSIVRESWFPTVSAVAASGVALLVATAFEDPILKLLAGGGAAAAAYSGLMGRWIVRRLNRLRQSQQPVARVLEATDETAAQQAPPGAGSRASKRRAGNRRQETYMTGPNRRLTTIRCAPTTGNGSAHVTVVITCYNYAQYLAQAIRSALTQTGVEVRVVIVDDASTDASLEVARQFEAADARVRVVASSRNLGPVGAFNLGLDHATSEFLVRLDADDLLTPGSLERAVTVLQAFPEVGLVYGHPLHFSGDELPAHRSTPSRWDIWSGRDWLAARCADGTNVITSPEVVMRRSLVSRLGGMRRLAHTHDMELWLRLAAHSDVAYIGGADQAWHREHPASLSTKAEDPLIILAELRAAFDELFGGFGSDYPAIHYLHSRARRAVASQALAEARRHLDHGEISDLLVDDLRAFALETDSTITSTKAWLGFESRRTQPLPSVLMVLLGAPRRLRRRIRTWNRFRRWHRTGVYERLRFVDREFAAEDPHEDPHGAAPGVASALASPA